MHREFNTQGISVKLNDEASPGARAKKSVYGKWKGIWHHFALADRKLEFSDKVIIGRIRESYINRETHTVYPQLRTLGPSTGMSPSNADKCLKRIVARGYLRAVGQTRKGRYATIVYTLSLPSGVCSPEERQAWWRLCPTYKLPERAIPLVHSRVDNAPDPLVHSEGGSCPLPAEILSTPEWTHSLESPSLNTLRRSVVGVANAPPTSPKQQREEKEGGWPSEARSTEEASKVDASRLPLDAEAPQGATLKFVRREIEPAAGDEVVPRKLAPGSQFEMARGHLTRGEAAKLDRGGKRYLWNDKRTRNMAGG